MSLKPLQSHLTQVSSLYAPYFASGGGGGGGGSAISTVVLTASTLTVSSISGSGGQLSLDTGGGGVFIDAGGIVLPQNDTVIAFNGLRGIISDAFQVTGVSSITGNGPGGALELTTSGGMFLDAFQVVLRQSTIVGLSSINGVAYAQPPLQGVATAVNSGNIYVPAAGTTVPVASFSTLFGHLYQLQIPNIRVQNEPAGVNTAGAWCELAVNTTTATSLDTFDMASVSTIANDLIKTGVYSFVATGANHTLQASGSANALSTAITINGGVNPKLYLADMGIVANFPTVG